jgi:two-component system NtrC family sensor kinase
VTSQREEINVPTANLLVIRGVEQGKRFELDGTEVSIGRGVRNQIRVLDTEISRHHAVISYADGAFTLTDRNSSNGTFLNGLSISSHRLTIGDQIQIGRTTLLFSEERERKPVSVDIVPSHADQDASQIVGKVGHDEGRRLLEKSAREPSDASRASRSMASLRLLYRISEEVVSSSLSIEQLLQRILDTTLEAVGADRGCVLVTDPQTGELDPKAVAYRHSGQRLNRMPVSSSIVDYVLKKGQGVRTSDARADSRFASGISIVREGIREAMCVPMPGRYELMGVLYVDTTTPSDPLAEPNSFATKLTDDELSLLAAIGRQAALAVEDHRYQEAFVKAERLAAVGQTIAILSHHIKNILQGVRGGSYLIDNGLRDDDLDMVEQGWSVVDRNQNRIYDLVNDLLTLSKERQPKLEPGSVNELVRDIYDLMRARSEELQIELRLSLADEITTAMFDQEGIHRAVLNVVINAIDALNGQEQGIVELRTGQSSDGGDVWIEVADNGPGIPEDQLEAMFNIFESTKGSAGTGIGLAVSQKILREHGGEIDVESQLSRGSRFRLIWPANEDGARRSLPPQG